MQDKYVISFFNSKWFPSQFEVLIKCDFYTRRYALMRQCWNFDAQSRPTFTEIVFTLENILTSTTNEEYLDLINVPYFDDPDVPPDVDFTDHDVVDGYRGRGVHRPFLR